MVSKLVNGLASRAGASVCKCEMTAGSVPSPAGVAAVEWAIQNRRSVRAFSPQAVSDETINHLLELASRAPSGTNTQPWKVYVLGGECRQSLVGKVCAAHDRLRANPALANEFKEDYDYYPEQWVSPYIERRRENGWGLYGLLGISKADKDKMHEQHQRNFHFFDAPVGLMFTLDRVMGRGSLLDYGMFLQSFMIAASAMGLATCAQAAWNPFEKIVKAHIGAGAGEILVCGMALGYADETKIVNTFHTPRVPVANFTQWLNK